MADAAAGGLAAPRTGAAGRAGRLTRLGRLALEPRQDLARWQQGLILLAALALGFLLSAAILLALGVGPADMLQAFVVDNLFIADNLRAVLTNAVPLVLAGQAAAIAFRVRFWNLGVEGQMVWGAIGAGLVPILDIGPPELRLPLMLLLALPAGMAWAAIAATLKLRLRVNEIISTLLLNYIAAYFLLHLLFGAWLDPADGFPHSPRFDPAARLPDLAWDLPSELLLALVATLLLWWLVAGSRFGVYMRFVEANERMARAVGIRVGGIVLAAALLSGALAALAGFALVSGEIGRVNQTFFDGYVFSGVLIAFLARSHPLGVALAGFLVALLFAGGSSLQIFFQVPIAVVEVIQALIVIMVAGSEVLIRYRLRWAD